MYWEKFEIYTVSRNAAWFRVATAASALRHAEITCVTNRFIAQREVGQTAYLLKCMSIPLSKHGTLAVVGQSPIAAIKAHYMQRIYFVGLWFTVDV